MADRDKISELLAEKCIETCAERGKHTCSQEWCRQHREECTGYYADHLVANGVRLENKQAIKQATSEWVSVEDRLPQTEGLYLVAVKNDHNRRYSKTAWFYAAGGWFSKQSVTHWMELPAPPEEVRHGQS